jgi:PTS system fructose-specific IIC component/PTS system nitrogen regulatory IIA component
MVLEQVFAPQGIILNLESEDKDELFEEMLEAVVKLQPSINRAEALKALHERENKMTTGIMHQIAVPHGVVESAEGVVGAIGISRKGIDYDSLDKAPVHVVFLLACSPEAAELHLKVFKELAAVLQNPAFVKEIMEKKTVQEVYDYINQKEMEGFGN